MLPIQHSLRNLANPEKAKTLSGFFKTGKWQYGEWDQFLGIQVPDTRKIVQQHLSEMNFETVLALLESRFHEERLAWVLTLVTWAKRKTFPVKDIAEFYMKHVEHINNWDFVDTSAPDIIGPYIEQVLTHEERVQFINTCISSSHLWTNRIIVLASFHQIKQWNEKLTFYIVPKFLDHPHDLMHKACGWMLREAGKRVSETKLCEFLDEYASHMPRTMLRYAIERLSDEKRKKYMNL